MRKLGLLITAFCQASPAITQPVQSTTVLIPVDPTSASMLQFKSFQQAIANNPTVEVTAPSPDAASPPPKAQVGVRPIGSPLEAVAALQLSTAQVASLEREIATRLTSEPTSSKSFLRTVRENFQNTPVAAVNVLGNPTAAGEMAIVRNTQLGVNASLSAAILRARAAGLDVRTEDLQRLPAEHASAGTGPAANFFQQYNISLNKYARAISAPTLENQSAFLQDARLTTAKFVESWPMLRKNPALRREAVRRYVGLAEQSPLKAIYGLASNFDPETYIKIFQQTKRTVVLEERNEKFCSGYLLSQEWVMTAGHCLKRGDAEGFRVMIKDANDVAGGMISVQVDGIWPPSNSGKIDDDPIDYSFLHIRPDARLTAHLNMVAPDAPTCLNSDPLDYEEPVIVIGYRGDNHVKVYDHANVLFPFRALPDRFSFLSAMTGARIQRLADAWYEKPPEQEAFFEANMTSFEQAYVVNGTAREFRAERGGLARRPYFGMDTDTFQGNSGAPVLSRSKVCVTGVFSGGAADNARIYEGTWKEHEFAVPLSEIAEHLRKFDVTQGAPTAEQIASRHALLSIFSSL